MSLRTLGDVLSRSGPSVTITENGTVRELAKALGTHGIDAVSVLSSEDNALTGIATARDVAKCMARSHDLDTTPVAHVMTPNPITLPPTESPGTALALMRKGRFRHIPVVSDSSVTGIVNVLSLAYDAITRLQLSYSMIPSRRGYEYMRAARERIEKPTLRSIVENSPFATLKESDTVQTACEVIVTKHLAAVVIVDDNGVLDGIFTCSDVVKRIVVHDRNPAETKLAEVMTRNPDSAAPDFTILESLQRMQACGFRHLPVVEEHSRVVVGLVDVLQLASDTVLGFNTIPDPRLPVPDKSPEFGSEVDGVRRMSSGRSSTGRSGLGRGFAVFFGSLFSNSFAQRDVGVPKAVLERQEMAASASQSGTSAHPRTEGQSAKQYPPSNTRRHYSYLGADLGGRNRHARGDVPLASFKFKDINNEYRRIKVPMELEKGDFDQFLLDIRRRYSGSSSTSAVKVRYVDDEGDDVVIANDDDLASCFEEFVDKRNKTIRLKVTEVDRPAGSKIQSPVSSAPSSVLGTPDDRSVSSFRHDDDGQFRPSVDPPPVEQPFREVDKPTGVYRTKSKPVMHTPSSKKAAEGHQMMLDSKIEEAIGLFTEALTLDPGNARAQGERGAARLLAGSSVEAEEDYRAALQIIEDGKGGKVGDLTFQMCVVGLAEALIDQRRYEEALTVAGQMDPDSGNHGCVGAFRDELDTASTAAVKALEAGDFGDAMSCYTNAMRVEAGYLKLAPGETARSSLRLGRAKCYKALEDYDMALDDYEAAVKLDPESVAGHKGCGKCLAELEQMERALESYERAHKLDPADVEVSKEVETIRGMLPDPMKSRKEEIAKLGAMLGGLNLPSRA